MKESGLCRIGICLVITGSVTTGYKFIFGNGTKLTVQPKEPADPKYYELQKNETKACLATDFSSHNATDGKAPFMDHMKLEATRVEGDKHFSKAVIVPEGYSCPTSGSVQKCTAEDGYEPDAKMNFLSLSVLCLRILFLKTIVFNVLMTIRVFMR
ncbi:M1-specific T cell receptor alpha chain-like [Engraulis encrasicolus]|uniref:M1-specific T cell receptor alpha chain-like n=1 Tax=Engraulis encrasicolus TaxID=184585 RepID=UPI002FD51F55